MDCENRLGMVALFQSIKIDLGGPFGMKLWKKLTTRVHPKVQPTSAGINFETHIKEDNQLHQDGWVENFQSCSRGPEYIVAHYPPSLFTNQVDGPWLYHFNFPGTNFFFFFFWRMIFFVTMRGIWFIQLHKLSYLSLCSIGLWKIKVIFIHYRACFLCNTRMIRFYFISDLWVHFWCSCLDFHAFLPWETVLCHTSHKLIIGLWKLILCLSRWTLIILNRSFN